MTSEILCPITGTTCTEGCGENACSKEEKAQQLATSSHMVLPREGQIAFRKSLETVDPKIKARALEIIDQQNY